MTTAHNSEKRSAVPPNGESRTPVPGSVLYEFARFVTDSWDAESPGKPFIVDPESSLLAIAGDIAERIASGDYANAHVLAEQTHGCERLAAALARDEVYLTEFASALGDTDA